MSKVVMTVKCNMQRWSDFIDKAMAALPDDKKQAFAAHWHGLQQNGCVAAETVFHNGTVYCAPSDDFRRALAEFGVVIDD